MAPNVDAHEEKVRSPAWIYPRSAKLYVDKVEFGHLSLLKRGNPELRGKSQSLSYES